MLKIISAPFHPELEEALVAEVTSTKHDSPLHPLAIIVPSQQLARRVKWLLAVERQLTLLDVHVLTFHQLALTLIREHGVTHLPCLVSATFREECLRYLVTQLPDTDTFRSGASAAGTWKALWASLQDLKEARVDPPAMLAAVQEQLLAKDNQTQFLAMLRLYAAILETDRQLGTADPDDLAELALSHVGGSTFLGRLRHLYYYGFYDLTQGQLDFFRAITRSFPAMVFFPLHHGNPNYRFAQQFFERYMGGAGSGCDDGRPEAEMNRSLAEEMRPVVRGTCRIYSVVGFEEEVSAAAKEIMHLLEDQQMQPHEIGVVVRTLDPVLSTVRRVLTENCIPFSCPTGDMLSQQPLVKTVAKFLTLRANNFRRTAVIDVLTSPFCHPVMLERTGVMPRPSQWDGLTRRLNIAQAQHDGLGDWQRLERAAGQPVSGDRGDGPHGHDSLSEQAMILWDVIQQLYTDLSALPERASWDVYVTRYLDLLPRWFRLDSWRQMEAGTPQEEVELTLRDGLRGITTLAMLKQEVTLTDWTDHAIRVLERTRLQAERRDLLGVQLSDAMDARGVSFRALFILGLNEKIFPRAIQEDALLRDADREVLSRDLGYKIPRKLDGFDEERLLFALLLRSARERLYLSYQRADENGRTMPPSSYLFELQEACAPEIHLRRRPVERWQGWPYGPDVLTPAERAVSLVLNHDSSGVSECLALRHMPGIFNICEAALQAIEQSTTLTPYDGLVGRSLDEVVVSPTALERYARCPFQYFAAQVLRLQPLPEPDCAMQLEPRAQGQLYHAILKAFYQRVANARGDLVDLRPLEVLQILGEEADAVFQVFEEEELVGYPLLWEVAKDQIVARLKDFVACDLTELRETGYRPRYFEIDLEGTLELLSPSRSQVRMHGKIDRIDVREERDVVHARIVDYKYISGNLRADDNNLFVAAARAKRLQPPLYLQLARSVASPKPLVPECVAFYFIGPKGKDGTNHVTLLEAQVCERDTSQLIQHTLTRIVTGIQEGRFPILPGPDYCSYCDFAVACRVMHDATRRRARTDRETNALKALREIKVDIPAAPGQPTSNHD
jgi:ATP-dependent helicase/nuclease subunit B